MRTITVFTLLLVMFSAFTTNAQVATATAVKSDEIKNKVIIMTDEKEPFTVFLNDKKVTPKPGTRHEFENLDRQSFNLRIDFFKGAPSIKKKLMVKDGMEATYAIKKGNGKEFVFQLKEEKALAKKIKNRDAANLEAGPGASPKVKKEATVEKTKNRVIIMTKENDPFTVFLNDKKVTPKPGTKHVLEDLDRQSFNLKIDFYKGAPSVKKKLMVKDGMEATYELKKVNGKDYAFQLIDEKPLYKKDKVKETGNLMGSPGSGTGNAKKDDTPAEKTHNNRVVIYNDTKEPFSIFLNGKKVTPKPGSKHVLENLDRQSFNLKIDFYKNIPSINKKLMVKDGMESTFKLKKGSGNTYIFQLEKERKLPGNGDDKHNLMGPQGSKKKIHDPKGSNANVNIAVATKNNNKKAGANVKASASAHSTKKSHLHSSKANATATKPKTGTVTSGNQNTGKPEAEKTETKPTINTNVDVSSKSCGMDMQKYRTAVISISNKSTDDAKLIIARQVADNYCLTSSQIKVIMEQFTSESTKLNFAKHAYVKCDDKNQYYIVNDAFKDESSVDALDKHIKKKNF
jgi:flagellar basal body-associated protein FliL